MIVSGHENFLGVEKDKICQRMGWGWGRAGKGDLRSQQPFSFVVGSIFASPKYCDECLPQRTSHSTLTSLGERLLSTNAQDIFTPVGCFIYGGGDVLIVP